MDAIYIRANTELRTTGRDPVEAKLRRDTNNRVYGKTAENLTERKDIKFVNSRDMCRTLLAKPQCLRFQLFVEEVAAIELLKGKCMINKPSYMGFAVLELSKFHCVHFMQCYPDADKEVGAREVDTTCSHDENSPRLVRGLAEKRRRQLREHASYRTDTSSRCVSICSMCLNMLQCVSMCLNVLQCVSMCFNVIQCVSMCFDVSQCVSMCFNCFNVFQ